MSKLFVYIVNGTTIEDTEAFGQGWKNAVALATEEHTSIERQVIRGNEIRNEFYAKAGCFLPERFYDVTSVKIF